MKKRQSVKKNKYYEMKEKKKNKKKLDRQPIILISIYNKTQNIGFYVPEVGLLVGVNYKFKF